MRSSAVFVRAGANEPREVYFEDYAFPSPACHCPWSLAVFLFSMLIGDMSAEVRIFPWLAQKREGNKKNKGLYIHRQIEYFLISIR